MSETKSREDDLPEDNKSSKDSKGKGFKHRKDGKKKKPSKSKDYKGDQREEFDKGKNSIGHNDVRSYMRLPYLSANAANLWFNNVTGVYNDFQSDPTIPLSTTRSIDQSMAQSTGMTPGIFKLFIAYGPGVVDRNFSAYNTNLQMFAQAFYSATRKPNSGARNYEYCDLTIYLLCVASIYVELYRAAAVYGIYNIYNTKNRYYGEALVKAMGFDWNTLSSDPAGWRAMVAKYSYMVSQLALPGIVPVFQEWFDLFTHAYLDRPNLESQLYVFRPYGYYQFTEEQDQGNTVGNAVCMPYTQDTYDKSAYDSHLHTMISAILYREDIGLMSGDLLKAFDGTLLSPPLVDEGFLNPPIFNEEINVKIENADILNSAVSTSSSSYAGSVDTFSVRQASSKLVYSPAITTRDMGYSTVSYVDEQTVPLKARVAKFFNLRTDDVSPEMVMIASRWKVNIEQSATKISIMDAGTEIVVACEVLVNRIGAPGQQFKVYKGGDALISMGAGVFGKAYFGPVNTFMAYLSQWQYAPFFVRINSAATTSNVSSVGELEVVGDTYASNLLNTTFKVDGFLGDLDNFHITTTEEIRRLHYAAVASVWYIDGLSGTQML